MLVGTGSGKKLMRVEADTAMPFATAEAAETDTSASSHAGRSPIRIGASLGSGHSDCRSADALGSLLTSAWECSFAPPGAVKMHVSAVPAARSLVRAKLRWTVSSANKSEATNGAARVVLASSGPDS